MSSAEQYVRTEHPVIDSDPHFNRVVSYMRGSDYAAWGTLTVGAPAVLLALGNSLFLHGGKGSDECQYSYVCWETRAGVVDSHMDARRRHQGAKQMGGHGL